MEQIEKTSSQIGKKMWNILRIVIYLTKKSNKLVSDPHMLLKRGKLASKSINYYYSSLTCKSNDVNLSFVSPREYEFSCSNTPVRRTTKRKSRYDVVEVERVSHAVKKVVEILNPYDVIEAAASLRNWSGHGNSPNYMVRQLRVTDSPFQAKDETEEAERHQVDKDAEDFINKFYKELKNQS